ncbi:MAG: hypothetical protein ACOYM1_04410 [Methylovulum sp.]|jgi:hypothetical protein
MQKLHGKKAAEILFKWLRHKHKEFDHNNFSAINNRVEWLPTTTHLIYHLGDNHNANLKAWPWQARALCYYQISGWIAIALSPQCHFKELPIESDLLNNQAETIQWLLRTQIVTMSNYHYFPQKPIIASETPSTTHKTP